MSEYALPESGFTAPEDMEFAGWTLNVEVPQTSEAEAEPETEAEIETEAQPETVYQVGDAVSLSANATLVAQWQAIPEPITITFDGNGAEGEMEPGMPDEEGNYELPESAFTAPESMEFAGWLIGEEPYQSGDVIEVTEAVTAVAQWQAPAQPITITFDANGAEGEMEAAQPDEEGNFTLPENGFTAPEGATFAGWLIGEETHQPGDEVTITEDTVILVLWQSTEPEAPTEESEEPAVEATEEQQTEEPIVEATEEQQAEEPTVEEEPAVEEPVVEESAEEEPELVFGTEEAESEPEPQPEDTFTGDEFVNEAEPVIEEAPVEEPPVEEPAVEEPAAEARPAEEEIPAEEIPAEETNVEQPAAEQPAESTVNYTVSFDGGGDGVMEAVQVTGGSEYTLPNPGYTIEGATFDCWEISGNGEAEPFVINAGETLIVGGDMTATAMWAFSEEGEALEAGTEAAEETTDVSVEGDEFEADETEAVAAEDTEAIVEDAGELVPETVDMPSEVGSVFNGAGVAAIIAAVALVLAAAGIAVIRKKKK